MVRILGQCGSALTNVLQSKFGCTTVLHGVDATCAGQSRKPSVFPEERFSIHLSKSFKVSVWKDDLTSHRVDAEVNAANNWLKHCGGLAKALSDAGGPAIQQDSDQYIFRKGKLSIGDAIINIAPPGYLPCRKIIHAVGPNLPYNNRKSEVDNVTPQLQRAVLIILKVVKQDNLQSVAIPAINSGLFNYPLPLCADVIVKTLKEYHASMLLSLGDIFSKCLSMAQKSAFPAIGTGVLGFSKQEVAKIMMDTAVTFSQHNNGMNMDIFIPRGGASPYIELSSAHNDILREAKCWLTYAFMMPSENFTILNGFIQHFGQREFDKLLSLQTKWNVSIEEFFKDGRAGVIIQGSSRGVRASVLESEAIFCKVQEDFAKKEECDMGLKSSNNFSRTPVENNSSDDFSGLEIVRVEKVENSTLKHLFELKKRQFQSASSQRMYQRLPAQYCDLVSRVGFQREFAPPDEQNHGEGIYFGSSVHGTEKLWRGLADEEYLYFFAAQVLTGKSTIGIPGLIVPPETPSGDPLTLYDSVEGGVDTCVIFNGHQALRLQFTAN
uniref:protein mono-ADP-ribosyltransferase PARP9-like n=1 Tax=Oncorhynchus gorbuscha TaxID=8017 RepID=UPI001EAEFD87|nr:protein mono-ADP-ribosyltransferase PARP9-like [Oncorhynchus gorbuscha]